MPTQMVMFAPKLSQKEQIYEYIKSKGRVLTHELIMFGAVNHINDAKERARQLKGEGRIWRIREDLMPIIYGYDVKELAWSIWPADLDPKDKVQPVTCSEVR